MTKKKYELLIFDWDGTLMDSAKGIVTCVQETAKALNLPVPECKDIRSGIGLSFSEQMERLFPGVEDLDQAAFREHYEACFYGQESMVEPELFDGVVAVLHALHQRGYTLAIATSLGSDRLRESLGRYRIDAYFSATRGGDQALGKPHPQMLLDLMNELVVAPENALMIGDTEYDLRMARHADMDCIGVTYGSHDAARLEKCQPIAIIDDIHELLTVVGQCGHD